jgi:hypothetical protein
MADAAALLALLPPGNWTLEDYPYGGTLATDSSGANKPMLIKDGVAELLVPGKNAPPFRANKNLRGS